MIARVMLFIMKERVIVSIERSKTMSSFSSCMSCHLLSGAAHDELNSNYLASSGRKMIPSRH